jgi:hypothetical protein
LAHRFIDLCQRLPLALPYLLTVSVVVVRAGLVLMVSGVTLPLTDLPFGGVFFVTRPLGAVDPSPARDDWPD